MTPTGRYDLRIVILTRTVGAQLATGDFTETWPEPTTGTNEYYAAREALTAGESIAQGVRASVDTMKLRIKGRAVAIEAVDRLKKKATGEIYQITGVWREKGETVVLCDLL